MNKQRNCDIVSCALILVASSYYLVNRVFADDVNEDDITYHFFDRDNSNESVVLDRTNRLIFITESIEIVLIIHGWGETWESPHYDEIRDGLLSKTDSECDVILVDWSGPASALYPEAAANSAIVGKLIGDFIVEVSAGSGIPLKRFHVVGHSLGAQTAGAVGRWIAESTGSKLGRITALDPAGPLFSVPLIWHEALDKNDARVVVVIHTDGGFFGYRSSCGTLDLFPNGGSGLQPGCPLISKNDTEMFYCSHHRSKVFFAEILRRKEIYATECYSYFWYVMGWCKNGVKIDIAADLTPLQTGNYYFKTTGEPPYLISD